MLLFYVFCLHFDVLLQVLDLKTFIIDVNYYFAIIDTVIYDYIMLYCISYVWITLQGFAQSKLYGAGSTAYYPNEWVSFLPYLPHCTCN